MSDFNAERWPIARDSHRCVWCPERIAPGTRHLHYVGIWNGDWQNWRMHKECAFASGESEDQDNDGELCNQGHPRGYTCRQTEIRNRILEAPVTQEESSHER